MRKTRAFKLCIALERLKIEDTLQEVCLLIGRVFVMFAKVFILLKNTCRYGFKNTSAQGCISLHVIFKEYVSSASYLLGTHDNISFCEILYSFYLAFLIHKSSILQFESLGNSGICLISLPNKAVLNLIFEC